MGALDKRFPIYSRLLKLYPADYQERYSGEILQTLADMLDDPESSPAQVWLRTALDFPLSLGHQQVALSQIAFRQMPGYMKLGSLAGAVLVAPFFLLAILDSLTNHRLYHSFFWSTPVIFTWLIILPGLAFFINAVNLLRLAASHRDTARTGFWRFGFDIRTGWPALAIIIIGLGIIALALGHDSVHCVVGNPITEAQRWDKTWQCIQQG